MSTMCRRRRDEFYKSKSYGGYDDIDKKDIFVIIFNIA